MLKMGIVGAENSHCTATAKLMNIEKAVNCRVSHVWGETDALAKKAAADGKIPVVVKDWHEMVNKVDGVMITHRHAKPHYEVAKYFIENGIPCFVDKPFTFTLREGKALCKLALKYKVPITSFSILVLHESFKKFRRELKRVGNVSHLAMFGTADIASQYGGIFFYGIHQVDPVLELFGTQPETAELRAHGKNGNGVALLTWKNGPVVTINCGNNNLYKFHASAMGDKGFISWDFERDARPYLPGARLFTKMFRTGKEPFEYERFLAPIAVLEALSKSLESGKPVKVAQVTIK